MELRTVEDVKRAIDNSEIYGSELPVLAQAIPAIAENEFNSYGGTVAQNAAWVMIHGFCLGVMMGRKDERARRKTGERIFPAR